MSDHPTSQTSLSTLMKSLCEDSTTTRSHLCSVLSKSKFENIVVTDISGSGNTKVRKDYLAKKLIELLTNIEEINKSLNPVFNCDTLSDVLDNICDFNNDQFQTDIKSQLATSAKISEAVTNAMKVHSTNIETKLAELQETVSRLTVNNNNTVNNSSNLEEKRPDAAHIPGVAINNPTKHSENYTPNFISEQLETELCDFLATEKFTTMKNGWSAIDYGKPYKYTGSKSQSAPPPIPDPIKNVVQLISSQYENCDINQCTANKYIDSSAELSEHSDDEITLKPESDIFTVSLGSLRSITFRDVTTGDEKVVTPETRSLYIMSQPSQFLWTHRMDAGDPKNVVNIVRYSLTFRCVEPHYKNSCIILGDSNTKYLKFGDDRGSFGDKMPGRRVETFHIGDIDPMCCIGYQNIILHVGINDLRDRSPGRKSSDPAPSDIKGHFMRLKQKIEHIQKLCPKSSIIVSLVLPTMIDLLNNRAGTFNRYLCDYVYQFNSNIRVISHDEFVKDGALDPVFGCYQNIYDKLHLGKQGIKKLAKSFKDNALRYRRRTDIREYRSVVSNNVKSSEPSKDST